VFSSAPPLSESGVARVVRMHFKDRDAQSNEFFKSLHYRARLSHTAKEKREAEGLP
jgi:hypothetical protein